MKKWVFDLESIKIIRNVIEIYIPSNNFLVTFVFG